MRLSSSFPLRVVLAVLAVGAVGCPAEDDDDPPGDTDDTQVEETGTDETGDTEETEDTEESDPPVEVLPPIGRVTALDINGEGSAVDVPLGTALELVVDYEIANDASCSACQAQVVVGIDGEALGCVYDDVPGTSTASGQETLATTAAAAAGTAVVQAAFFNSVSCDAAKLAFEQATLDDDDTIGSVETFEVSGAGAVETITAVRSIYSSGGSCTTLDCPAGKTLLSMGLSSASSGTHLYYYPMDVDTGKWCFQSENVTLQLTCGTATTTRVVTADATFGGTAGTITTPTLDVACSAGETMMGGYAGREGRGLRGGVSPGIRSVLRGGLSATGTWRAIWNEWATEEFASITGVCSSARAPQTVQQTVAVVPLGDACVTATCPGGMVALGGGYELIGAGSNNATYTQIYVNHREGTQAWKACYHSSYNEAGSLKVEAYCAVNR